MLPSGVAAHHIFIPVGGRILAFFVPENGWSGYRMPGSVSLTRPEAASR